MHVASRIAGTCRPASMAWPRIVERFRAHIPPEPTPAVIPPPTIPAPALLAETDDDAARSSVLALAYIGVMETRTGYRLRTVRADLLQGSAAGARKRVALLDFADALLEARVAPVAWCAFSFDAWRDPLVCFPKASTMPSLAWTYSVSRFAQRRRWFEEKLASYMTPVVDLPLELVELYRDWRAMQRELLYQDASDALVTVEDVRRVVEGHFPAAPHPMSFAERVVAVRRCAEIRQAVITQRIQRGECLW